MVKKLPDIYFDLSYRGGQGPIVHLEADLHEVMAWADSQRRRWAFSLSNAGAVYAQFRASLDVLGDLNWPAIDATDFRSAEVKEGKQAEFLVYEFFPRDLVRRIGIHSIGIKPRVDAALNRATHRPMPDIRPEWYY